MKIRSPEHCLKIERWQGPPNKKQSKTVACLFSLLMRIFLFLTNNRHALLISDYKHKIKTLCSLSSKAQGGLTETTWPWIGGEKAI